MGLFDDLQKTPELPEENEILQPRGESLETPDVAPETTEEALLVARDTRKNIEQEEGMKFGTPVDFAEQFNNTIIAAAGAPVDLMTWALNGASKILGGPELIDPETAVGGSKQLKGSLGAVGIGSDEKADTYLGYTGNTFGEAVAFMTGGAAVVQKTKQAGGVIGSLSRQADDALRNKLGTVIATEAVAAGGMAAGRQYAEENEMGATGSLLLEFTTGAMAMVSAAAAKQVVLDPLTAKLKNMTATEALEKLSKEEVAEVVARGREEKAKVEPEAEAPKETPEAPAEPTPDPKDTPFSNWQEQDAYAKEIGGLGLNRNPSVDATLTSLSDDALETAKVTTSKELDVLEDKVLGGESSVTQKDVDDLTALQDKSSAIENEEFRRQIELNIKEYRAAQTDAERQETLDFLLEDVFNKLGKSNQDDFKVAYFIDQIEREGLFNEFAKAHKRAIGERAKRDPDYAYAYEEVFNEELLDKFKRGKKVLDDIKSSPKTSKENSTASNIRGDTIEGPTLNTPALDAPEATPKSPMQQLFDDYEKTIADQARGEGADAVVRLNAAFNAASDDFAKRVDALIATPDAKNVDEVVAVLDDYIKLDELDADLKQKTGQMLNAQQKNAKDNVYTKEMAENRQTRQEALKDVREKLQALKADADGSELQKLVDNVFEPQQPSKPRDTGDAPIQPEGTPKPTKTSEPKATPQQRAVARLQKRLDELRAIRSGEQDPKAPKPKKAKSAEEIDLEARIKFYQGEAKEVAEIASTEERIQVLSGLLQGGSTADIRAQIGLPPKFRPSHAKPKKIESTLSKLKATEAKLLKKLRRKQTDEILSDMRDVFDPENGRRSLVDQGLNKYLLERTDALLNQPSTMTTGLPSGIIQVMYRPLVGTGKSTLQALNPLDKQLKGVGMTARMKYAAADAIATAEQLISLANNPMGIAKQVGRNVWDTAKAGGQSAYYYKDGNKMDVNLQGASVGNSTIRNERQVRQASLRVEANKQKNFIIRKALETISSDPATTLFVIAKAARSAGRVGVGTFDEPFILMLEGRKQRADAIRAAIKQQIPKEDVAQFIDDYVSKSSSIEGGVRRFNYLDEKYRNAANEHRRALFRRGDFDGDDPRMLMEEHFAQFWNKATGGDITMGKFFARFLQPIITTPTIALAQAGRTALRATGIPAAADVGQRVYSGVAKRIGKDGKISHALSGRCLLYTSPSPRDGLLSRMPSSA